MVLLAGEPGIGKSRLVEALREATRGDGRASLRYQTSPHHTDSTLWPVIRQLERAAELGRDDALEVRLDKLERFSPVLWRTLAGLPHSWRRSSAWTGRRGTRPRT